MFKKDNNCLYNYGLHFTGFINDTILTEVMWGGGWNFDRNEMFTIMGGVDI